MGGSQSLTFLLLILFAFYGPMTVLCIEMAHIQSDSDVITHVAYAKVQCGGLISLDSLHPNMPGGSSESAYLPYYPVTEGRANSDYVSYEMRTVSVNFARLVEDSLHTSITNVIIFEIDGSNTALGSYCDVEWDPRLSWLSEVETSSLSLAVLQATPTDSSDGSMCQSLQMSFNGIPGAVSLVVPAAVGVDDSLRTSVSLNTLNTRLNNNGGFPIGSTFPATILAPPQCKVQVALLATHYGKYSSTVRWLPLTIFSALFLPLVAVVGRKGLYAGTGAGLLTLGLTFVGYAGSCVGVSIELATWTYPLHPFPFPGAVTMYLVAAVVYGFILMLMLWGHPLRVVATHAGFNMLLYGLSIGLMVGYFMRAFLIIGILSILMIGLLNLILIILTVYFAKRVPRSFRAHTGSQHALSFLAWFPLTAPVVPVTYFALQLGWTGYQQGPDGAARAKLNRKRQGYTITAKGGQEAQSARAQVMSQLEIVDLHSVLTSVLFIIFHNSSTLALLLAACIYHTPFVVALFPVLCFMLLHIAFSMQEYTRLWRHFGGEGILLSLDTAIAYYARQEALHRSPSKDLNRPRDDGYSDAELDVMDRKSVAISDQAPQARQLYYDTADLPQPGEGYSYGNGRGAVGSYLSAYAAKPPSPRPGNQGLVPTPPDTDRRGSLSYQPRNSPEPIGATTQPYAIAPAQRLTSPAFDSEIQPRDTQYTAAISQSPAAQPSLTGRPPSTFRTVASMKEANEGRSVNSSAPPQQHARRAPSGMGISGRSGSAMLAAMNSGAY